MPRLLAEQAADAPADANTPFSWHLQGLVREEATAGQLPRQRLFVDLEVEGAVWLQCQRCLKAYEQPLPVRTRLEVMRSEAEADAAPLDDDEADVIVGSRHFDLITQIEDELLLALPVSPRHAVCPDEVLPEEAEAEKKPSPFAAFKSYNAPAKRVQAAAAAGPERPTKNAFKRRGTYREWEAGIAAATLVAQHAAATASIGPPAGMRRRRRLQRGWRRRRWLQQLRR